MSTKKSEGTRRHEVEGSTILPERLFGQRWIAFSPDDEGGSGSGDGNSTPAATPATTPANTPAASFQRLLDRNGSDALALAQRLFDENFQHREQIRDLQGRQPAAGAVILSADEGELWARYRELGNPDELATARTERDQFQGELATHRKAASVRSVAEIYDYKATVLAEIIGDLDLSDIRTAGEGAGAKRDVYVKDGDKEITLPAWIDKHKSDFKPALEAEKRQPATGNAPRPRPNGVGGRDQHSELQRTQGRTVRKNF